MTTNKVITSFRENVIWVFITAIFTLLPFYYNTTSSLEHSNEKIELLSKEVKTNQLSIQFLSSSQMVEEERFKSIEKRLENIEKKLDYLIENSR